MPYHLTSTKKFLLVTVLCGAFLWSNVAQIQRFLPLRDAPSKTIVQFEGMPLLVHPPEITESEIPIPSSELELMEEQLLQKENLLKELEQKPEKITIE